MSATKIFMVFDRETATSPKHCDLLSTIVIVMVKVDVVQFPVVTRGSRILDNRFCVVFKIKKKDRGGGIKYAF